MLGPKIIGSIAITGSDLYLRAGSDVAVLFEAKDAAALKNLLSAQIALSAKSVNDVKVLPARLRASNIGAGFPPIVKFALT